MEMKAAVEADATVKATAKAAVKATAMAKLRTDWQAWHPQGALPPGAVMPGMLGCWWSVTARWQRWRERWWRGHAGQRREEELAFFLQSAQQFHLVTPPPGPFSWW
jgi:hypothetical protein